METGLKVGILSLVVGSLLPVAATAAEVEGEHSLQLKTRGVFWKDENTAYPTATVASPKPVEYEQSALSVELNYKSPFWGGFIGVDASAYGVLRLGDSGTPTTNLVELDNGAQLKDGYATIGQAALKLKYKDMVQVRLGRQLQDSLLLKSTSTRAVPDTYSGASASVKPMKGVTIYGAVYDQWRARSTGYFEGFRTEATAAGVPNEIDYISIVGAGYADGPFSLTAEYLNAKSYLSKIGVVGAYSIPLGKDALKLSAGLSTSRDAGKLFVCSAERELDCTGTGRLQNDGQGVYVDADWKVGNFTLGAAVAKFDGLWIEDNFAVRSDRVGSLTQDHGTTPFPTSAGLGPDFANNGETVGSVRLSYDWKDYAPGLRTAVKVVHGSGAKSSNLTNDARGSENYREFTIQYALPFVKNLSVRYIYMDYDSKIENGSPTKTIKGMPRQDWEQHRLYIDYSYQF